MYGAVFLSSGCTSKCSESKTVSQIHPPFKHKTGSALGKASRGLVCPKPQKLLQRRIPWVLSQDAPKVTKRGSQPKSKLFPGNLVNNSNN